MSKVDPNQVYVALASEDDSELKAVPLKVDPSTGRLLMAIADNSPTGTANVTVHNQPARRDENRVEVALAVTDDSNADITPFHVDQNNGYLSVDLNIE